MQLVEHYFGTSSLMCRPANEILRITRMLLSNPCLWTQGSRARDAEGNRVKVHSSKAVCWSLNGALALSSNPYGITPIVLLDLLDEIVREWGLVAPLFRVDGMIEVWEDVDDFNDQRPHCFILAVLDEAITRLENV